MLVKELIKILKKCNASDNVYIEWPCEDDYSRYDPFFLGSLE